MTIPAPQACDLIIRNGCVLTLDAQRTVYPAGAVAVSGHSIVAVGPEARLLRDWRAARVIDAGGAIVHPGFIDTHLHVNAQTCRGFFRGDASKGGGTGPSYADWKAALAPEDEQAAAALAGVEMLRHGITTFVEPGSAFDPDAVAATAQAVGVRCSLADPYLWDETEMMKTIPGLLSPSLARRVPPDRDRCLKLLGGQLHRNRDRDGIVHGHVALYGEGTASDELLRAAKSLADREGVILNSHIGYDLDLAAAMEARWGKPRFVHLAEIGVLGRNTLFVHMNLIRDEEVEPILTSGAASVWCPFAYASRATVLHRPTRLPEMKRKGATVALGTDSARQSSAGDAGYLAFVLSAEVGHGLTAEEVVEMSTLGGARAAGLDGIIGSIEPGKRADIVLRSARLAELGPGVDPAHQLIAAGHGATADTVLVNGRIVMRGGRPTLVDEGAVLAEARASVVRMAERLDIKPPSPWPRAA
ncbi:MAG: amidohydrolase family protein [Alphaproteobacteria bacterium]|nr:amidohydrolase family protein [Alphaproteobacteria bacterium]